MANLIPPFGRVTVNVPAGQSIAIYTPSSCQVFQVVRAPNYPEQIALVRTIVDSQVILGPFASGAELIIEAVGGFEVNYEIGVSPSVQLQPIATGVLVTTVAGTTYTILPTDWGKQVQTSSGSATTITINAASLVGVPAGTVIAITQGGGGTVSVVGSGVTVRSTAVFAQYVTVGFQVKANGEVWAI